MNVQQRIIWLAQYYWAESREAGLFDSITSAMFPDSRMALLYERISKDLIAESDKETLWRITELFECGIDGLYDSYTPIHPGKVKRLKEELHSVWREANVGKKLNEAHDKLLSRDDYTVPLGEIGRVEDSFEPKDTLGKVQEEILSEHVTGRKKGFLTGIEKLDSVTLGLKGGHLWIIGGYTGRGKTTLALQIVRNLLKSGTGVSFISLEMSTKQLLDKLVWLGWPLSGKAFPESAGETFDFPLDIADRKTSMPEIEAHINARAGVTKVFVVDYLQNITGDGKEYDRTDRNIKALQRLAIDNDVCIIVLSQMSNDAVKDEDKSQTMGFKGGGTIAACADVALEIQRKKQDENTEVLQATDIIIRKNRHGGTGAIKCSFDTKNGYFVF